MSAHPLTFLDLRAIDANILHIRRLQRNTVCTYVCTHKISTWFPENQIVKTLSLRIPSYSLVLFSHVTVKSTDYPPDPDWSCGCRVSMATGSVSRWLRWTVRQNWRRQWPWTLCSSVCTSRQMASPLTRETKNSGKERNREFVHIIYSRCALNGVYIPNHAHAPMEQHYATANIVRTSLHLWIGQFLPLLATVSFP